MSKILTLKLDVTKIHKDAIYVGQKGKYITVSVFVNDEKDDYGNYGMIRQNLGKERREAGEKGPILGNVVRIFNQDSKPRKPLARDMDQQARDAQRAHGPVSRPLNESDDEPGMPF